MPLALAAAEFGDAGPPLIVLHGLFGSGTNWRTIAQRLAQRHRVFALDLRNHGASPWAEAMDYAAMAADVGAFVRQRGLDPAAVLGHSMGGKAAMMLALTEPALVERLLVVDVAPAAYPPRLRAYAEAMRAIDPAALRRRGEADAPLRAAVPDAGERAFLLQNLVPGPGGGLRWRLNLPVIERSMETIAGWPRLPDDLRYPRPTLFVAGARSDHVRPEHHAAIRRLFPRARIAEVADAGHWLHAEKPEAFLALAEPFLAEGVAG